MPTQPLRQAIAAQVRAIFQDSRGRAVTILRDGPGLYPESAIVRRVHADVTVMLIGGVRGLLIQMLHPAALAGVWDHSGFRADMDGRLRRTAAFIAVTTYASRDQAGAHIARVRRIHDAVTGTTELGTPYRASDPHLLGFVHAAEATSFLAAHLRYREPGMTTRDQDRYCAEMAEVAALLGVVDPPRTRLATERALRAYRPELYFGPRAREVAALVLNRPARSPLLAPMQALTMQAAVDLLPEWARTMHRLDLPLATRPLVRAGAGGLAGILRWAMAAPAPA